MQGGLTKGRHFCRPFVRFICCEASRGHRRDADGRLPSLQMRCIWTGNPSATGAADFGGRARLVPTFSYCLLPVPYCLLSALRAVGDTGPYGCGGFRRGTRPLRVRRISTGSPSATGAADFDGEPVRYGCGGFRRASNACPYVLLLPVPYCLPSALRAVGDAGPYGYGAFGRGTRPLRVRRISAGNPPATGAADFGGRAMLAPTFSYCLFPTACHPLCGPSGTPAPTGTVHLDGEPVRYGCGGFRRGTRPLRVRRISAGEQCLPLRSPIACSLLPAIRFAGRRGRQALRVRCIWTGNPPATGAADFDGRAMLAPTFSCCLLPVSYCLPPALRAVGDAGPYGCGGFRRASNARPYVLLLPVAYSLLPAIRFAGRRGRRPLRCGVGVLL